MVEIPKNTPVNPEEPEYTYCCGTCCDREKLAWEFEDLKAKAVVADKLVADLLNQIAVLETTNKALRTQQALYYEWYLEGCALSEKLRVELQVKRDKSA